MLKSLYYRVAELALGLQLYYKETSIRVFSCEIFEIFLRTPTLKNTYKPLLLQIVHGTMQTSIQKVNWRAGKLLKVI